MKRNKVSEFDVVQKLQEEDRPFPLVELASYFSAAAKTIQKRISGARKNGHHIIPTTDGNWYLVKITTKEQLRAVFNAIEWEAKIAQGMATIGKVCKDTAGTAPERVVKELESDLKGYAAFRGSGATLAPTCPLWLRPSGAFFRVLTRTGNLHKYARNA
jgi:hypothetical protein